MKNGCSLTVILAFFGAVTLTNVLGQQYAFQMVFICMLMSEF